MKKQISLVALVLVAVAMLAQSAEAGSRRHPLAPRGIDPRVTAAGVVTGVGATVGYFAMNDWKWRHWNEINGTGFNAGSAYLLTSVGCAAVAPMVATVAVRRQLTAREAGSLIVGCFIPVVGPLVLNAMYEAHPEWEASAAPAPARRRHHR